MMRPQFNHWLGELCLFYSNPNWPTDENVNAAFRDVQHMDGLALEFMGAFIRREYQHWPRSLSYAMHKAYERWQSEKPKAKNQEREISEAEIEANARRTAYHVPRLLAKLSGMNAKPNSWVSKPERRG